jgi:ribosomal protein S18 acetylase RimI-like enzyme
METFSELQSRGFLENQEAYATWHPWLRAANFKNLQNKDQYFFIAEIDGTPAGVVLMIVHEGIAGIYAVATPPQFRKNGVSTSILKHAVIEAKKLGCSTITLQVKNGSYAESLYRKLGFKTAFEMQIFGPAQN